MKKSSFDSSRAGPLLYRWDDIVLSFSVSSQLKPHAHGAAELVVALETPFRTRIGGVEVSASSVLIPPGTKHQNIYTDPISAILYLDPESYRYQQLAEQMSAQDGVYIGLVNEQILQQALLGVYNQVPSATDCYAAIVDPFLHGPMKPTSMIDARIASVARIIKKNPSDNTSVKEFASQIGLSEDRLHHLFTNELGIPLHKYRIWLRLKHASQCYLEGENLTFAAHNAGFADAAHFSRTFSRMYGASPSKVLSERRNSKVLIS